MRSEESLATLPLPYQLPEWGEAEELQEAEPPQAQPSIVRHVSMLRGSCSWLPFVCSAGYGIVATHLLQQMIQTAQQTFHSFRRIFTASSHGPSHGVYFIKLKLPSGIKNNSRRDRLHLIDKRTDKRVLAQQICDPGDAARIFVDSF